MLADRPHLTCNSEALRFRCLLDGSTNRLNREEEIRDLFRCEVCQAWSKALRDDEDVYSGIQHACVRLLLSRR